TSNPAVVEAYLREFPNGRFARMAKARWEELNSRKTAQQSQLAAVGGTLQELEERFVVLSTAKVRTEASASSRGLRPLTPYTMVCVTGRVRERDWLRILYNNGVGYVSAAQLHEVDSGEAAAWGKLKNTVSAAEIEAFLKVFPHGFYTERAGALLTNLRPPLKP